MPRLPYTSPNPETAVVSYNIAVPKIYKKSQERIPGEVIGELQIFILPFYQNSTPSLHHFGDALLYMYSISSFFILWRIISVLISLQS